MKTYPKANPGEVRYVEYDAEFEYWGVFGEETGFCFGQFASEKEAEQSIK